MNSEADSFFLLAWINTGMTLIIKGLFKGLENQMTMEVLSHLNIDLINQILMVFIINFFFSYTCFHFLALDGGIDLFGDTLDKHPEYNNCADALQVIMHFRLNSLEFMIQLETKY